MNEYLTFRGPAPQRWDLKDYMRRGEGITKFGFAIPDDEVIATLAALGPIVELGAGLGYWAHLITEAGGEVDAYDPFPGKLNGYSFKKGKPWFPIKQGGVEVLETCPHKTLLLIWPCYKDPWSDEALQAFRGDTVAYVGEGHYGCTATDEFHERLYTEWTERDWFDIPNWDGIHDVLRIYDRKPKPKP